MADFDVGEEDYGLEEVGGSGGDDVINAAQHTSAQCEKRSGKSKLERANDVQQYRVLANESGWERGEIAYDMPVRAAHDPIASFIIFIVGSSGATGSCNVGTARIHSCNAHGLPPPKQERGEEMTN